MAAQDVSPYAVLVFAGACEGLFVALKRARGRGWCARPLLPVLTVSLAIGFVGARLGAMLQHGWLQGGLVLYGGLATGAAACAVACRRAGLPALSVADLALPCAFLGAAFGRIGCFFGGCCYGKVFEFGLCYPPGSPAFRHQVADGLLSPGLDASLTTIPMPLLESVSLVVIFIAASAVWRRSRTPGTTLAVCGLAYSRITWAAHW
jgi:phosphatidylglycerol:prolipoprotein diacylglycerol transferase